MLSLQYYTEMSNTNNVLLFLYEYDSGIYLLYYYLFIRYIVVPIDNINFRKKIIV